ncbi:hypothetical protein K502DRAFT_329179 [Neoconidiobolus thromboides FSU 785]|nr:hypothetical protein K502DRAFT_329179 [Neoconidiobolus thromboides FSU 785]
MKFQLNLINLILIIKGLDSLTIQENSIQEPEELTEYVDLVEDITGTFRYVKEQSDNCPSAYALIITEKKEFIRSYCFENTKQITFGTIKSKGMNHVIETPTPEEESEDRKFKVDFLWQGFRYGNSVMIDCDTSDLEEAKLLYLFGDFEEDNDSKINLHNNNNNNNNNNDDEIIKECHTYRYISFYSDGQYSITRCPDKDGNQFYEDGVFSIQHLENDIVDLELLPESGYKYDFSLKLKDKDHMNDQLSNKSLKRCFL